MPKLSMFLYCKPIYEEKIKVNVNTNCIHHDSKVQIKDVTKKRYGQTT